MVGKLGMRTLVLGTDAAMGANRAGDVKAIGVLAQATGVFELEIVDDRGQVMCVCRRRHPADAERAWGARGSDRRHDQGAAARVEQEASGARSARVELDERAIPARTWSYQAADEILGHAHAIEGTVVHGEERGRTIGFPTANLGSMIDGYIPVDGVYAGWLIDLGAAGATAGSDENASDDNSGSGNAR